MFQGDWGMLHQQENGQSGEKLRIAHFCILYIQMPCLLTLFRQACNHVAEDGIAVNEIYNTNLVTIATIGSPGEVVIQHRSIHQSGGRPSRILQKCDRGNIPYDSRGHRIKSWELEQIRIVPIFAVREIRFAHQRSSHSCRLRRAVGIKNHFCKVVQSAVGGGR